MKVSNKRQRDMQRAVHIVGGLLLLMYVYSPAGAVPVFGLLMQVVVMPVLILSGVLMWQGPRLRKVMQDRRGAASR